MTGVVSFTVLGLPVPKGRARSRIAYTRDKKPFVSHYTPSETVAFESRVALKAKMAMQGLPPIDDACEVLLLAFLPIPASWNKKKRQDAIDGRLFHITKPDIDNVYKSVADAMNGIVYTDDSRICGNRCEKHYSDQPRIEVEVRRACYQPLERIIL